MDMLDFELLFNTAKQTSTPLVQILSSWQTSSFAGHSYRDWLLRAGPGHGLPGGGLPSDWNVALWTQLGWPTPPEMETPSQL